MTPDETAPVETKAVVVQPVQLADVKSVIPSGSDAGFATVLLSAIAVLGGGTAWKFWTSFSKQKHAEAMARIENESKMLEAEKKLTAERAAMDLKMAEVENKLEILSHKLEDVVQLVERTAAKAPVVEFNEEMTKRLAELEKLFKKPVKPTKKAR